MYTRCTHIHVISTMYVHVHVCIHDVHIYMSLVQCMYIHHTHMYSNIHVNVHMYVHVHVHVQSLVKCVYEM